MGYLGLGSTITMLQMKYGDDKSVAFTEEVTKSMAMAGWETGLELAREKGPAPVMSEVFEITGEMVRARPEILSDGYQVGDKLPGRILHPHKLTFWTKLPRLPQPLAETPPPSLRSSNHRMPFGRSQG